MPTLAQRVQFWPFRLVTARSLSLVNLHVPDCARSPFPKPRFDRTPTKLYNKAETKFETEASDALDHGKSAVNRLVRPEVSHAQKRNGACDSVRRTHPLSNSIRPASPHQRI